MDKLAVVVLTRGYSEIEKYADLIGRNRSIEANLGNVDADQLVFHEGNITVSDQNYIQSHTPELTLTFIDISAHGFVKSRESVKIYPPTNRWGMGYRHMCSFWFVDFWKFTTQYSKILRIDEDCIIKFPVESVFSNLDQSVAVYGKWWFRDGDSVVAGINPLTIWFFKKRKEKREPRIMGGPYTNVIGFNLAKLREKPELAQYIQLVADSQGIYSHRWGDLPLWGEVLEYFFEPDQYGIDKSINYHHGSHDMAVNS